MIHPLRLFLFLLAFVAGIDAHAENIQTNSFIRKKGTYVFDQNGSSIEVITAKDNVLSLAVEFRERGKSSSVSQKLAFSESGILRAEGWFVFFESANRLWIFDGKKSLSVIEADQTKTLVKECDSKAAVVCPARVKDALPTEVRESVLRKAKQYKAEE